MIIITLLSLHFPSLCFSRSPCLLQTQCITFDICLPGGEWTCELHAHIFTIVRACVRVWDSYVCVRIFMQQHILYYKISGAIFQKGLNKFLVKFFPVFLFFWFSCSVFGCRAFVYVFACDCMYTEKMGEKSQRDREITPASPAVCRLNHSAHRQNFNMHTAHTHTLNQILYTIHKWVLKHNIDSVWFQV